MSPPTTCVSSALRALLSPLLSRGACLVFPGFEMPVPIPLNECVLRDERHLLWATLHSPHGATRPCVGLLVFDSWQCVTEPRGEVVALLSATGGEVARIASLETLGLSTERARRLREEQARHEQRAARDPAYVRRWALRFREASAAADQP